MPSLLTYSGGPAGDSTDSSYYRALHIRFHMKSGSYMGIQGAKDGNLYLRSLQCLQVQEKGKPEA